MVDIFIRSEEFNRQLRIESFIEDFLNRIDEIMILRNITRAELAKKMKCTETYIDKIMGREKPLTAETIVDMAFYLNLDFGNKNRRKAMKELKFKVGDIVKFKKNAKLEPGYIKQEEYVLKSGYKFNHPYKISKITDVYIFLENKFYGNLMDRFEMYEECLSEEIQTVEIKSDLYCNCGGPWVENCAGNKSFKVCRSCGKEVL